MSKHLGSVENNSDMSDFWFKEIILAAGIRNRLMRPCLKIEQLGGHCSDVARRVPEWWEVVRSR